MVVKVLRFLPALSGQALQNFFCHKIKKNYELLQYQ